jgi:GDPmannose 4,6-dehydratase
MGRRPTAHSDTMKRVVIVGSGGQDGQLLWNRLCADGDLVVGLDLGTVQATEPLAVGPVDILNAAEVAAAVEAVRPDEIYYLAAYHHSSESRPAGDLDVFEKSFAVNVRGLLNFLEAMRIGAPQARLVYAASSRVFGRTAARPQDENTPMAPVCPYGISKAAGVECCRFYRDTHGLFAAAAILYNHESPQRRPEFVSQRIARGAVAIKHGEEDRLVLGDLEATADWGWAPDTVDALVRIARHEAPEDFVVATGQARTVRQFAEAALGAAGIDPRGRLAENPSLVRRQNRILVGDAGKLWRLTGWKPTVTFREMVALLVQAAEEGRHHV